MNERKTPIIFDERELNIFRNVCTSMYLVTIGALIGMQLFRQFKLGQPSEAWNDIAMVITINVVVLLGAVLYLTGAVNPKNIKRRYLLAGYVGFVLVGLAWTIFKYAVLLDQEVSLEQVGEYLRLIVVISGILGLTWGVLALIGNRRIERKIE